GRAPTVRVGAPAYFGLKLSGNYRLPGLSQAYMATGHNSAMISSDNKRYIVYHTRFEERGEVHEPRTHQYLLNEEAWPCMLPYATDGETVSETGYDKSEIVGDYYVINQGTKIDAKIAEPVKWVFTEDGFVYGQDMKGTWTVSDGKYYVHISTGVEESEDDSTEVDDEQPSYSGVFCKMKDEAGTEVMTFSAVGNNESIWGVKY
nr:glycoside hydrolase family 43 protein [Eubacterium sp.]